MGGLFSAAAGFAMMGIPLMMPWAGEFERAELLERLPRILLVAAVPGAFIGFLAGGVSRIPRRRFRFVRTFMLLLGVAVAAR